LSQADDQQIPAALGTAMQPGQYPATIPYTTSLDMTAPPEDEMNTLLDNTFIDIWFVNAGLQPWDQSGIFTEPK
jgi:hypothetical protein